MNFEKLFKEYYPRLVHYCFQLVKDRDAAEDIVQEAFARYWDVQDEVVPHASVIKTYLYNTVRNISLNTLRHNVVVNNFQQQNGREEAEEAPVVHAIIRSEVLAELYKAIGSLPEGCRTISRLSYFEGLKVQEIADRLGVSVNTVKTQKQRALHLLRQRLSPELYALLLLALLH